MKKKKWEQLARAGMLEEAIKYYLQAENDVTFIKLQNDFKHHMRVVGDKTLMDVEKNVVLWEGLSNELHRALDQLWRKEVIRFKHIDKRVYEAQGRTLAGKYRISVRVPPRGYKDLRWKPAIVVECK